MEKGYVQVYTGDGKGKTTAMLGLTVRAIGAGLNVYIGQFLKDEEYSEIKTLKKLSAQVFVEQFGSGDGFVYKNGISKRDIDAALSGIECAKKALASGKYDVVILDEINVAASMGLIKAEDILQLIKLKPEATELVLTGRNAPQQVIDIADLVTEMKQVKHYYEKGVPARFGIEK